MEATWRINRGSIGNGGSVDGRYTIHKGVERRNVCVKKPEGQNGEIVRAKYGSVRKMAARRTNAPKAVIHERTATADYAGLLSDVLEGLLSMTEENWSERCDELRNVLRCVVVQAERGG